MLPKGLVILCFAKKPCLEIENFLLLFCLRWNSSGHEEPSPVRWKGNDKEWNSSLVIDCPFHGVTQSHSFYYLEHPGSRWKTWQFLILILKDNSTQRVLLFLRVLPLWHQETRQTSGPHLTGGNKHWGSRTRWPIKHVGDISITSRSIQLPDQASNLQLWS